eukprot:3804149-Amphidinium_carterae.2
MECSERDVTEFARYNFFDGVLHPHNPPNRQEQNRNRSVGVEEVVLRGKKEQKDHCFSVGVFVFRLPSPEVFQILGGASSLLKQVLVLPRVSMSEFLDPRHGMKARSLFLLDTLGSTMYSYAWLVSFV